MLALTKLIILVALFLTAVSVHPHVSTLATGQLTGSRSDTNDVKRGLALLLGSDCATCHTKTMKLIGPSYNDIAKRYQQDPSSVARLAEKIIKGGGGAWGKVSMTPHNDLTRRDAQLIVRYIFTLSD
jgi:cytochrome c